MISDPGLGTKRGALATEICVNESEIVLKPDMIDMNHAATDVYKRQAWGFAFTAFACILGMAPQVKMATNPTEWWFTLITNIITPIALLGLGLLLPMAARREKK